MADYDYQYLKKRKDFGRVCNFEDVDSKILGQIEYDPQKGDLYIEQTILNVVLHNIPIFSQASVNTARVQCKNSSMFHYEGGWPKEVDPSENSDVAKWRKTHDKRLSQHLPAVQSLCNLTVRCIEQNNTIDLFEHYFHGEEPDLMPQSLSMKTVALFKDPADEKRSVTKLSWHPEGGSKIVGSYSTLRFQRMTEEMPMSSFVWDISERNVPLTELRTPSPLVCCEYNSSKQPDWLVAGCYNGILNWYDLKRGPTPCMKSKVEVSHWDPVYDVVWIQSKTAQDCASVSSDGRLLFWDVRKLDEVVDECTLTDGGKPNEKVLGGTCLEWMMEAGAKKFLVGSEHGHVIGATRNPKKGVEVGPWWGAETRGGFGKHYGPVYAVKRNPTHVKFFLTIGDWCCKMWSEELKDAMGCPMMKTPYAPSFLSAASWSPTRCGVFFLCRQDGYLDTWDYCYRMNEVSLSQKVSENALTSISVQSQGSLMAVGDADGVITLTQMCEALVTPAPNERNVLDGIFTRESKREKNLDAIRKQAAQKKQVDNAAANITINEEEYRKREAEFLKNTKSDHDSTTLTPTISHRS
mmetsp:Transcript_50908/g.80759  ORF Transcript_50908/g.80759 Transcript_50908/m.80759 type:complete len:578 (-) Transcript_50908:95-1828(-)|eukprot:CAMPEP_0169097406 /NCGR_PEP_ID=MMETSP1015-20121227/19506_1 /TAXON_ID=342587 /ORGANISM="Karlodinium micrum, Strain CCMP2283" /LENGTH=577 /DNA_ID=CAMNT_0009158217 /DNA_START=67 /DNA_END=1800 /DNA_ORIENTATION=-